MSILRLTEKQYAERLRKRAAGGKSGPVAKAQTATVPEVAPAPRTAHVWIPWPPTVNHSWRPNGRGGKLLTAEHKAFRADVAVRVVAALLHRHPLQGRLRVTIHASPQDKRARDLDNLLKGILDALQHAGLYVDDAAIDDLRILRVPVDRPGCNVFVEVIAATAPA